MHLAHLVGLSRIEENPLRNRRLAGIDMGNDSYVPYGVENWSAHGSPLKRNLQYYTGGHRQGKEKVKPGRSVLPCIRAPFWAIVTMQRQLSTQ
jgi:hypothetical protein